MQRALFLPLSFDLIFKHQAFYIGCFADHLGLVEMSNDSIPYMIPTQGFQSYTIALSYPEETTGKDSI